MMSKLLPLLKYRKYVSPSLFYSAMGYDQYITSSRLKHEIENGYQLTTNPALKFGIDHEPIALYWYQKLFKTPVYKALFKVCPVNPRIGGIADGLIGDQTGLEIKCHIRGETLTELPFKYIVQMAGYMYLYQRSTWILFSCVFNEDHQLTNYRVFVVTWDQVKDRWENECLPLINKFMSDLKWKV